MLHQNKEQNKDKINKKDIRTLQKEQNETMTIYQRDGQNYQDPATGTETMTIYQRDGQNYQDPQQEQN